MSRKLAYLVWCVLLVGPVWIAYGAAPEGLVAHWPFDEGQGTTAFDTSGNGNDGTISGGALWVAGMLDGALEFNGADARVVVPHIPFDNQSFTIAMWVNPVLYTGEQVVFSTGLTADDNTDMHLRLGGAGSGNVPPGGVRMGFYNNDLDTAGDLIQDNNWYHLTFWYDYENGNRKIFIDGVQQAQAAANPYLGTTGDVVIGAWGTGQWFRGIIDDVQVYHRALSDAEVVKIMEGLGDAALASDPVPADEATDVPREVVLGWTPGEFAATHDVYFGMNFADVNDASRTNQLGVQANQGQSTATYDPPGRLEFGQAYYWRIDEVNAAPDDTIYKGDVWSFTVEPELYPIEGIIATASISTSAPSGGPAAAVNGSGLSDGQHSNADPDMWLGAGVEGEPAWIQFDFDRVYKLYEIHIWNYNGLYETFLGFGVKDITIEYATEPNEWTPLGEFEVPQAPGRATYTGETIDAGGIAARSVRINLLNNRSVMQPLSFGLSEVQFLHKPVFAREPSPADQATEVSRDASLSWRPGREAASHLLYIDTDSNAVAEGAVAPAMAATSTYDPGALNLGTVYYWRVDEVNDAEVPSVWDSALWSFTAQEYVSIDNFESYTDDPGSEIFSTWLDGYNVTSNGSLVGHDAPPYAEQTIAHSGQSMPLYYSNTGGVAYSEAELDFAPAADWTANEADTLSLYYRGEPTGFAQVADDEIIMNGTGSDIWGTTDEFRFVYKQLTGNGSIIARIEYLDYTNEWAKAGVMIRQTLDSDSMLVDGIISADGNVGMQWRSGRAVDMSSPDASNTSVDGGGTFPGWVKLTRVGNDFTVYYSTDGVTWQDIVPDAATDPLTITVAMTDPVYIGLAVTSHATGAVAGSHFTGISTTGNVTGQWQSASIGIDQPAGNGIDRFYLTVQDSSNNTATFTNPLAAAVAMGTFTQWTIPLSDISAEGVNPSRVTKLILGVGDASAPSKNVSGILYIDDIAFGSPIE